MISRMRLCRQKKAYPVEMGRSRRFTITFFLVFFGGGPVGSEVPALEDAAFARFRVWPLFAPTARGSTSSTWSSELAGGEGTGYENATGIGSCTSKI